MSVGRIVGKSTFKFELFYYGLKVENIVMRDKPLNQNAIEVGCVFEKPSIMVNQLAILHRSCSSILFFMLFIKNAKRTKRTSAIRLR